MGTVRISTPEVGQCSGILIGPQRRDTETLARLSVLIRRITLQIALDECYALKATASQGRLPGKATIRPSEAGFT